MPRIDQDLLRTFRDRLVAGQSRNPLLRVTTSDRGRILDCARLDDVKRELATSLVNTFVTGGKPLTIDLDLQVATSRTRRRRTTRNAVAVADGPQDLVAADKQSEQPIIYHLLEQRIRRQGELIHRETGCQAIWLGYPLLLIGHIDGNVLSPLILWPAQIDIDRRVQGRLTVGLERRAGGPILNRALTVWIQQRLGVELEDLDSDRLMEEHWDALREYAGVVANQLRIKEPSSLVGELRPISSYRSVTPTEPMLLDSAVLGIFNSAPEAIIRDLERIGETTECSEPTSAFVTGERPVEAELAEVPPEEDRYFVLGADFSQERVVRQARQGPGLVVQGPPGTGKSQTIVNIIADALGREKTVLMVCQKETATRVVFERLRSVALHQLCLTTHNPEADRMRIFREIRDRVESLKEGQKPGRPAKDTRNAVAQHITDLEAKLDAHARALHQQDPSLGISYRQVMSRLFRVYFNETAGSVRSLEGLSTLVDTTVEEVEKLAHEMREVGRQFHSADAGRNPWRYRSEYARGLTPSQLRQEITQACDRFQQRSGEYEKLITSLNGPGIELPANLTRFRFLAESILRQFRPLVEKPAPRTWWDWIVLNWRSWRYLPEQPWLADVQRLTRGVPDSSALDRFLKDLDRAGKRSQEASELLELVEPFRPYFEQEGLEEVISIIRKGRSSTDWVERVRDGINRLVNLDGYERMRRQHRDRVEEIVRQLEQYEAAVAADSTLPRSSSDTLTNEGKWWSALVKYPAYEQWRRRLEDRSPELVLTPTHYESDIKNLAEAVEKKRQAEPNSILKRWKTRVRPWLGEDWASRFRIGGNQHVRASRFREGVEAAIHRGLLDLFPCWLVSPEVASQLLPLEQGLFDLVIFDEASQCPLEQAIPVIYRGKSMIVVGDEHQMPPTNFFGSRLTKEEDSDTDDDDEITDEPIDQQSRIDRRNRIELLREAESLLEAAGPTFRSERLLVHYRSEDPALIEFSNKSFYEGKLEAAVPPLPRQPIEYLWVGGTYERRTNREEAERVIEIVRDYWKNDAGDIPSIGVVTFNQPQRELIEDLLQEACNEDEEFRSRFIEQSERRNSDNQDVGFFVRNLENVQGDERDVIIFSTTFGRDANGRFYRRFGPVGARGGHRRLNVAVTRARKKNIIVSSMPIEEIAPPGATNPPAVYLQRYLQHAQSTSAKSQSVGTPEPSSQTAPPVSNDESDRLESPLEEEIYQVLISRGYQVVCQIGEAGFRIDLAIRHPDPARGYVLGIECDGATYHSDRSARIRDVWRQSILQSLGWKIYRVWSSRWWSDRDAEIKLLIEAVEGALQ